MIIFLYNMVNYYMHLTCERQKAETFLDQLC